MTDYGEGYFLRGEGSNYHGYGPDRRWPAVVTVLRSLVPVPALMYELGSATGWFLVAARRQGYEGYGVDVSEWAVAHAPKESRLWVKVGNALHLPWTQPADLIVSWELLEHIDEDDLPTAFDEMSRLSKPSTMWVHRIGMDDSDRTHRTIRLRSWWESKFFSYGLARDGDAENMLDDVGAGSDWVGRHFVWRVPC